jgi:hypothetical protein
VKRRKGGGATIGAGMVDAGVTSEILQVILRLNALASDWVAGHARS